MSELIQIKKIPKNQAGYVYQPGLKYHCEECAFISRGGKCTDYVKQDENVAPIGGCNDWQDLKKGRIEGLHARTRAETGYLENKEGFGCRHCEEMDPKKLRCKKISEKDSPVPGIISLWGCCNFWEKDWYRGTLSDEKLGTLYGDQVK